MIPLHHAYLLKGWLLDKSPPEAVNEALEAIIEELSRELVSVTTTLTHLSPLPASAVAIEIQAPAEACGPAADNTEPVEDESETTPADLSHAPDAPAKRKRNMSPEARAAAAERMRAMQARKRAEKEGNASVLGLPSPMAQPTAPAKPFTPVSHEKLISDHNAYAGKRDPEQPLTDGDWPDIKARLAKSPDRRAIASDYDVDLDDLNAFIDRNQRREGRSPGEALASPSSGASGAARPRW